MEELFQRIDVPRTETRNYEICLQKPVINVICIDDILKKLLWFCLHTSCWHEVCFVHVYGKDVSLSMY